MIRVDVFIKSFSVVFISDIDYSEEEMHEIASFICDNIACCMEQTEVGPGTYLALSIFDFAIFFLDYEIKTFNICYPV